MLDRIFDLAKINEKIGSFNELTKKDYYDYLINEFGALFAFNSNRIEGANKSLTLNDTRSILNNTYQIASDVNKQREIRETINHQQAFTYIFDAINKEIDIIDIIKEIHKIIGKGIIEKAGLYKIKENYLINSRGKEIVFTTPNLVEIRMEELKNKYNNEWQKLTVFERAVHLHMAIINIHPFKDGNGRVARLIMNYELIKNNYPPIIINEAQKLSYYAVIKEINLNTDYENNPLEIGNIEPFTKTVMQLSILTFKDMQDYFNKK